ncbi:MAG: hypothetical protein ACI4OI_00355, partial [Gemmiger sp.]
MLQAIWTLIVILGVATLAAVVALIAMLRGDTLPTRTMETQVEPSRDNSPLSAGEVTRMVDNAITNAEADSQTEFRVQYDTPDFTDKAGFSITAYPDHEIAIPMRFWLINNDTAEIEYNIVPSNQVQFRVAKTGLLRIPSEYRNADYESVTKYDIDGTTVTQSQSPGRKGMVTWSAGGFDYAILSMGPE